MHIGRSIFVFLVAASVAWLPVAGAAAPTAKSIDSSISHDMSDCCPAESTPCDKASDTCAGMSACLVNPANILKDGVSDLAYPLIRTQMPPSLTSRSVHAQTSCPPFRPPRL